MPGQDSSRPNLAELSAQLFSVQEVVPRARILARSLSELLPGSAVNVYMCAESEEGAAWLAKASVGDATLHETSVPLDSGGLGELAEQKQPLLFGAAQVTREVYAHLDVRRTVHSLAYLPLLSEEDLIGAIEIVSLEKALTSSQLAALEPLSAVAASALVAAESFENDRNESLSSISRLTQLYDLEKVFSSTLEMDNLLPVIGSKFREVLECEAVNIWLLEADESVRLMHQSGNDPTVTENSSHKPGEGIAGDVSDNGGPLLIGDPADQRLVKRNSSLNESYVSSVIAVAIMDKESLVGVVEAVNKLDGASFDEDDLFALTSLSETASTALHNASLLAAERKVEVLETLVTVSHEITSTLNLERMLQTIVSAPQAVIPYERASISLAQRGTFKLSAVTGVLHVDPDSPELSPLNSVVQWAALSQEVIHIRKRDEEIDDPREDTRAKFQKYFEESGMSAFYAMPLNDDSGRVGLLTLESADPDFLGPAHLEILQVLASQATVALRNAQMYKEVPFISVLEPVLERKRRFMALEKRRRTLIIASVVAAAIFLAIFPLPLRLDGNAVVAPVRRAQVQPEFEGVVGKVYIHEGEAVTRGQVLAEMEAWDYRSALAEAESKYQTALLQVNRSLAASDAGEAGVQRVQADYWKAEVDRARELVGRAQLRSPIDGVVTTPHVENLAGRRLEFGDSFAEIVDASSAIVDIAVDDIDAGLLRPGAKAVVKLNSYPLRTFSGEVAVVSPKGEAQGESVVFFARVLVPNSSGLLRTGMEGRGKVSSGWHAAGYVFFRRPIVWLYERLWNWFGW